MREAVRGLALADRLRLGGSVLTYKGPRAAQLVRVRAGGPTCETGAAMLPRPGRWLWVAAVAVVCSLVASATVAGAPLDVASTHAALRALDRYSTGVVADADSAASRQADDAFVATITAGCPNVLAAINLQPASSVSRAAVVAFGEEAGVDLELATFKFVRIRLAALTRALVGLRWSTVGLATQIRRSLATRRKFAALLPSNLCADARALAANAQTTPAGTLQFLATVGRLAKSSLGPTALVKTIRRYETPADRPLAVAVARGDKRLVAALKALVVAELPKLLSALGLSS